MPKNIISLNKFLQQNKGVIANLHITNKDINNMFTHLSKTSKLIHAKNTSKADEDNREIPERKILCDNLLNNIFSKNRINGNKLDDLGIKKYDDSKHIGVIIEYKCPDKIINGHMHKNYDMVRPNNFMKDSFGEVIEYYLSEITGYLHTGAQVSKNNGRINAIITNMDDWYIISNDMLEKYFGSDSSLIKVYESWATGNKRSKKTEFFRRHILRSYLVKAIKNGIKIVHINIHTILQDTKHLKQFCKFLTPQCLLWKDIPSGNNTIKPKFYKELLYIMGLKESNNHKVNIIKGAKASLYNGTIARNIILQLKDHKPYLSENKMKDIAIHLSVLWINRLLFLKLLESQLKSFNNSKKYSFLNVDKLRNFQDVYDLFFNVMATHKQKREFHLTKFKYIPYLNSSLFDQNSDYYERNYLYIDQLRNIKIPVWKHTILTEPGTDKKETGKLPLLKYILRFLSAYDFTTLSSQEPSKQNNLINAGTRF